MRCSPCIVLRLQGVSKWTARDPLSAIQRLISRMPLRVAVRVANASIYLIHKKVQRPAKPSTPVRFRPPPPIIQRLRAVHKAVWESTSHRPLQNACIPISYEQLGRNRLRKVEHNQHEKGKGVTGRSTTNAACVLAWGAGSRELKSHRPDENIKWLRQISHSSGNQLGRGALRHAGGGPLHKAENQSTLEK